MTTKLAVMARRTAIALAMGLGGCDELGNPVPGVGPSTVSLVRESTTTAGTFVTEVRYVEPNQARALLRSLGDEVDHVDARVPTGQALVAVMVRYQPGPNIRVGDFVHLRTTFRFADDTQDARVWVARTHRPRFVAFFAVRAIPADVRTEGS